MQAMLVEYRRRASMGSDTFASRVRATKNKIERFEAAPPRGAGRRPPGDDAPRRRPHRHPRGHLRAARAARPHRPVRHRGRLRRAGRGARARTAPARATSSASSPASPSATRATWRLGARVVPGYFSQTHDHPELRGVDVLDILMKRGVERGKAMAALRRYGIHGCAQQAFETLSGGQQARLQILLLELAGQHPAPARRAHRQPRPGVGRGPRGGARELRRHRRRRHPRPLVPARLRPLPGLRPRRHRHRAPGARVHLTRRVPGCWRCRHAIAPMTADGGGHAHGRRRDLFDQLDGSAAPGGRGSTAPPLDGRRPEGRPRLPHADAGGVGRPRAPGHRPAARVRGADLRRRRGGVVRHDRLRRRLLQRHARGRRRP